MLHRTRHLLVRQRTQLINALRAHLAELGLVAPKGLEGLQQLMRTLAEAAGERLPKDARFACQAIVAQLQAIEMQLAALDKRIHQGSSGQSREHAAGSYPRLRRNIIDRRCGYHDGP